MRPTLPRLITIVRRSDLPQNVLEKVRPAPPLPSEQTPPPTLIDHLLARKAQRNTEYEKAVEAQNKEGGDVVVDAKPWPSNLRIEPVITRASFAKVSQSARRPLKEALKER